VLSEVYRSATEQGAADASHLIEMAILHLPEATSIGHKIENCFRSLPTALHGALAADPQLAGSFDQVVQAVRDASEFLFARASDIVAHVGTGRDILKDPLVEKLTEVVKQSFKAETGGEIDLASLRQIVSHYQSSISGGHPHVPFPLAVQRAQSEFENIIGAAIAQSDSTQKWFELKKMADSSGMQERELLQSVIDVDAAFRGVEHSLSDFHVEYELKQQVAGWREQVQQLQPSPVEQDIITQVAGRLPLTDPDTTVRLSAQRSLVGLVQRLTEIRQQAESAPTIDARHLAALYGSLQSYLKNDPNLPNSLSQIDPALKTSYRALLEERMTEAQRSRLDPCEFALLKELDAPKGTASVVNHLAQPVMRLRAKSELLAGMRHAVRVLRQRAVPLHKRNGFAEAMTKSIQKNHLPHGLKIPKQLRDNYKSFLKDRISYRHLTGIRRHPEEAQAFEQAMRAYKIAHPKSIGVYPSNAKVVNKVVPIRERIGDTDVTLSFESAVSKVRQLKDGQHQEVDADVMALTLRLEKKGGADVSLTIDLAKMAREREVSAKRIRKASDTSAFEELAIEHQVLQARLHTLKEELTGRREQEKMSTDDANVKQLEAQIQMLEQKVQDLSARRAPQEEVQRAKEKLEQVQSARVQQLSQKMQMAQEARTRADALERSIIKDVEEALKATTSKLNLEMQEIARWSAQRIITDKNSLLKTAEKNGGVLQTHRLARPNGRFGKNMTVVDGTEPAIQELFRSVRSISEIKNCIIRKLDVFDLRLGEQVLKRTTALSSNVLKNGEPVIVRNGGFEHCILRDFRMVAGKHGTVGAENFFFRRCDAKDSNFQIHLTGGKNDLRGTDFEFGRIVGHLGHARLRDSHLSGSDMSFGHACFEGVNKWRFWRGIRHYFAGAVFDEDRGFGPPEALPKLIKASKKCELEDGKHRVRWYTDEFDFRRIARPRKTFEAEFDRLLEEENRHQFFAAAARRGEVIGDERHNPIQERRQRMYWRDREVAVVKTDPTRTAGRDCFVEFYYVDESGTFVPLAGKYRRLAEEYKHLAENPSIFRTEEQKKQAEVLYKKVAKRAQYISNIHDPENGRLEINSAEKAIDIARRFQEIGVPSDNPMLVSAYIGDQKEPSTPRSLAEQMNADFEKREAQRHAQLHGHAPGAVGPHNHHGPGSS
ncbi:MAG: hypothetical protein KDD60_03655, partial [Bdellovibrionales bacterium]|nr:hypothetical protein [Bdellovibrionales bacterium]